MQVPGKGPLDLREWVMVEGGIYTSGRPDDHEGWHGNTFQPTKDESWGSAHKQIRQCQR